MIIDFPIVGNNQRTVLVQHGLMSFLAEVNNAETKASERDTLISIDTVIVRPAMAGQIHHLLQQEFVVKIETGNAAHVLLTRRGFTNPTHATYYLKVLVSTGFKNTRRNLYKTIACVQTSMEEQQETKSIKKRYLKKSEKSWLFRLAVLFLACIFITQAYLYLFFGTTFLDESDYLYTGSQIFERDLVLYDQIWTRMPPLLFYFYGASQTIVGPSFEMGRVFAFLATTLLLIVSFFTVKNATKNRFAGLLAVAFIVLHQKALSSYFRATASAPIALMVMLTIWALSLNIKEKIKFPLAFFFGSMMLMTRMNTIFLFLVLIGYMLVVAQDKIKTTCMAMGVSFIMITAVMIKFLMINGKNTLLGIFAPFTIHLYPQFFYGTANKESWIALPYEIFRSLQSLGILVAVAIPLLLYLFFVLRERRATISEQTRSKETRRTLFTTFLMKHHFVVFLTLGFLSIFLTHFWADDTYVFYSMPILAVLGSVGVHKIVTEQRAQQGLIIAFVLGLLLFSLSSFTVLDFSNPLSGDSDILRAKRSGAVIANLTEPDATIFIADNDTVFVKSTNRINMEVLNDHLENESDYVLIQSNRGWLKLNKPPILENVTKTIQNQLDNQYQHVVDIPNALPRRYVYGNGTISLYKRQRGEKGVQERK